MQAVMPEPKSAAALTRPSPVLKKTRLTRDEGSVDPRKPSAVERLQLREGETYRISYAVGGLRQRRVSRSIALFEGESTGRTWDGTAQPCLKFTLPHGRAVALLGEQLIDARVAELNQRGQWVLAEPKAGATRSPGHRRAVTLH